MESSLAPLLLSGVNLMLIGMGIVFSFLLLLVWIIQRTHHLLLRWEPDDATLDGTIPAALTQAAGVDEAAIVAAMVAAVHLHEQRTMGRPERDA